MSISFRDLDGWSFLVGFGCAYLSMSIAGLCAMSFFTGAKRNDRS